MLPKTNAHVRKYDGQTKWMYFLVKDDDLLEKCSTISPDTKNNLIANLSITKYFCKPK